MNIRTKRIILILSVICCFLIAAADAQDKFKLKPEAGGKNCLNCHRDFEKVLKKQYVHTPVKDGQCTGCHNPHAATHGKLLAADTKKMCSECHPGMIPAKARSAHKVVLEGNCVTCHDPHGAANKFSLHKAGNELCFGCHKTIGDAVSKAKFKHNPVDKGCTTCHDPHASAKANHLLKQDLAALCLACHKADGQSFVKQHMDYPVATGRCTSCHNPHGSNNAGIFYDNVHAPMAKKMCNQCHEAPTSPTPFKVKRAGFELCRGCHNTMVNETFSKNRIHWPLLDKGGCANCHEPHASSGNNLLRVDEKILCTACHTDTKEYQQRLAEQEKKEKAAATKGQVIRGSLTHQPIQEGNCSSCHSPHASNRSLLLQNVSTIELCGTCHDWLKHTSHPMGEKVTDPRNKNMKVDCLGCHRSHGTGFRSMIPYPTQTDLCTQCHKQLRR